MEVFLLCFLQTTDDLDKTLEPKPAEDPHENNVQPQTTEEVLSQVFNTVSDVTI